VPLPGWTEFKGRLDAGMKALIWVAIATSAAAAAVGLLCAALFIWIDGRFGPIWACVALAGGFLLVVCIAIAVIVSIRRRQARMLAIRKQSAATLLRDPEILTLALQVSRTLGLKRALPLVLVGAFLVGVVLSRSAARNREASPSDSDD
jgi:hypothetical protein